MVDSRVVCAECQSPTHEAEDCPHRKKRETNITNRVKHFQAKVDKLVREGLSSRLQPTVTPPSQQRAASDDVEDNVIWMSSIVYYRANAASVLVLEAYNLV